MLTLETLHKKVISVPIYNIDIEFVIVDDLMKLNPIYNTQITSSMDAVAFKSNEGPLVLALQLPCMLSNLMHELTHIVNMIYVERHMELDKYNDEPQVYLTGWICQALMETIDEQKEQLQLK